MNRELAYPRRYVNEFEVRHNIRPLDTADQMATMAANGVGKRLTYETLIGPEHIRHPAMAHPFTVGEWASVALPRRRQWHRLDAHVVQIPRHIVDRPGAVQAMGAAGHRRFGGLTLLFANRYSTVNLLPEVSLMGNHMTTDQFLSSEQAARELGISRRRMQQLLLGQRVVGARQVGRLWIVPTPVRVVVASKGPKGVASRSPP